MSSMRIMFARVCPITSPCKWWRKGCSKDVQGYGTPVAPWPDMTWPWRCSDSFEIEICCPQLVQFNQQPVTQHLPFRSFQPFQPESNCWQIRKEETCIQGLPKLEDSWQRNLWETVYSVRVQSLQCPFLSLLKMLRLDVYNRTVYINKFR